MKTIYMDNAATTRIDDAVLDAMLPFLRDDYGNASSLHTLGRGANKAVELARKQVAKLINAHPSEIYFTTGATEANDWATKVVGDVLVSAVEHPSLIDKGEKVGVDKFGRLNLDELEKLLPSVSLVSIGMANSETGVLQDIKSIVKLCNKYKKFTHTDATQALGKVSIDVKELGVDMMSLSAHKIFGPKGAGALFISKRLNCKPPQSGTANVPAIVGFGAACEIDHRVEYVRGLRDYMIDRIEKEIPHAYLNGCKQNRLCNNINFSFKAVEGESVLIMLDQKGIAVSTGSACASGSNKPSYVLGAMGIEADLVQGAVRFTLSRHNTKKEVDTVVDELKSIIKSLRAMSALEV